MKTVVAAAALALFLSLLGTPLYIKFLVKRGYGQFIRDDGPTAHKTKRGTPTMGGVVIITATLAGYFGAHLATIQRPDGTMNLGITRSGLLVLGLTTGLGFVGWLDDYIKISKQRSLGLRSGQKLFGQVLVGSVFAAVAALLTDVRGTTLASMKISWVRDISWLDLAVFGPVVGVILFVLWVNLIVAGTSNGVNLTDGLDGLATGASTMVFGGYVLISIWQFNQACYPVAMSQKCYDTPSPYDLAIVAAALAGACFGFLWWNASPAKIFMGDTGSLALGGALAGLAIMTRTELLVILMGGLFVIITLSVIIQVASFKMTGKRVFRMAPLQHHFELLGWHEVTIVIRFWIIAGVCAALALGLFYAEWIAGGVG
ncbi:Phospho-N-acetylmuramoyl-pentapeptide-transferase [Austwickia sp. TVS 96-490-7B]|uniref:phospho-N-acetylmuramoyl-pentapeptide- transferase n=1 Tax=Austwickia sp. TVS 96-490-7B TaxID=2830843 RepID=UPI001C56FCDE|nr:phospho-N-acetylmuramoyl-pentapeptide-transferase [Austwickia sp. TVS 96-490-7B]MBW3084406.1 Phospho-N-acetylmuramoyl-pentapeptide-transferase [Austwickia sp. TVS 96-490-7B]